MDKKILGFLWAMLGVVVGIVCLVGIVHCGSYSKDHEPADVVRDTVIDTIPYYKPVAKDSLVLTYKTVTLPKSDKAQPSIRADTHQQKAVHKTMRQMCVTVQRLLSPSSKRCIKAVTIRHG